MSLSLTPGARAEWRNNWKVVIAAGLGLGLMNVPIHSIGVFMGPLTAEFGWQRSFISSGMVFIAVSSILLGPPMGMAVDRFGPRRFAMLGSALICVNMALFAFLNANPWSWWALWALVGCVYVMVMPAVWLAGVTGLFAESRGLALAVALSGAAISNAVLPILGTLLIHSYGWRTAFVGVAVAYALVVLPVVFLYFTSLRDKESGSGKSTPQAFGLAGLNSRDIFRSALFFRFLLAAGMMMIVPSIMINIIPIATSFGHSDVFAAAIASLLGVTTFIGRLTGGYLLDRINGNYVAASCMALPVAAIALILAAPHSVTFFAVAAIIMGFCVGAELDAVAYLMTRHFGIRSFGMMQSCTSAIQLIVYTAGPIGISYSFDMTSSYIVGLWMVIPVCGLGTILFLTLGQYRYDANAEKNIKIR